MQFDNLSVVEVILGLGWLWMLVRTIAAGRIGGTEGITAKRAERPGAYWFAVVVLLVMVGHFFTLAFFGRPSL